MITSCTKPLISIKTKAGKQLSVVRPDKETVTKTKEVAKAIFVEAFTTTYKEYHAKSQAKESIETWLRLKEGFTIESWLQNTFDDEYAQYEQGERHFVHLYDEDSTLVGWLSHSNISDTGEVYLSQCSLEASSRHQQVATSAISCALETESLEKILPGVKEIKLITRKINEYAARLYERAGFTKDTTIDPSIYGDSYDDRYVGYRKKVNLSWQDIVERYGRHPLIDRQLANPKPPHIADVEIKSIPLTLAEEPFVDVATEKNPRIQMLEAAERSPNASKMRQSLYERLEQTVRYLDELAPSFGYRPGQVSIRVYEGLRDIQTQETLFNNKLAMIRKEHPELSLEDAEKETAKWISPYKDNIPVHSTGAAVDIRLWDEDSKQCLDMGLFGAIWGPNELAPTFSPGITDTQKKNRYYLLLAAAKADLTNYPYEYWHYSYGDKYASYCHE